MMDHYLSRRRRGAETGKCLIGDAVVKEALRLHADTRQGLKVSGHGASAFTLVELLIAVALVALLSVFLFSILDATSKLWKDNESRVDSYREARAALNFMARELASLHTWDIPNTFFINPNSAQINQSAIEANDTWASRLFFLATLPAEAQAPNQNRSDLCAIGYFLAYTKDKTAFAPKASDDSQGSYKLFRFFRSSDPTFDILSGANTSDPLFLASTNPPGSEVLAANVAKFQIKAFRAVPAGLEEVTTRPITDPPDMIELSLTALNERDAAKLANKAAWENHSSELFKRSARTFATRVRLNHPIPAPTPAP